jgi:hypothetical protein
MAVLLALLALAGCGATYAREARTQLAGRPFVDVEACIGVPDRTDKLADGTMIVQWSTSDAPQSFGSVPLSIVSTVPGISSLAIPASALAGSLPLTIGGGSCRAIAVVKDGVVTGRQKVVSLTTPQGIAFSKSLTVVVTSSE